MVLYLLLTISQAWSLPPCEGDESNWQNCEGSLRSASGRKYIGVFKNGIFEGKYEKKNIKYVGEYKDGTQNGQGTFIFADGTKYIGELKNSKPHGQGTFTFSSGDEYVGEFKDGKENGQGTFTFADYRQYSGEFKDGSFHGQGTFTFADGRKSVGQFIDGKCPNCKEYTIEYSEEENSTWWRDKDGKIFEVVVGSLLPPCKESAISAWNNCYGTATWPDGRKYIGEWKEGKNHGQGIFTWPGENEDSIGREYIGEWKDNLPNGHGTYSWDYKKYVGGFKDGHFHGQGKFKGLAGDEYIGGYKDGKLHGQGTFIYTGADKYEGGFKDGKMHGQGTYTWYIFENTYAGEFKDGNFPDQGTHTFKGVECLAEIREGESTPVCIK